MSGLDVAAGVIGIAAVGMKAAKGLVEIADAIGSAGEEVRLCASDIALFSQLLNDLGDALKKPTAVSRATQNLAEDTMDICEKILTPFNNLITKLTPLLDEYRRSQHKFRQIGLRIQWYFKHKSKVVFYQQSLGHLKGTLSCLLASMNLRESRANAPQQIFIHQMQVESSRASIEQQGRSDRATLVHTVSSLHNNSQLSRPGRLIEAATSIPEPDIEESLDDSDHADISSPVEGEVELTDIDEIDQDVSYDTTVALHIDLLSLQRKTLKFATSALDPAAPQEQARPKEPTSATPSAPPTPNPSNHAHSFPYEKCKTYPGAESMVRSKLAGFPGEAYQMDRGALDMCLGGEGVVSESDWTSRIVPSMSIYLKPKDV